jgi:hypothetical protein
MKKEWENRSRLAAIQEKIEKRSKEGSGKARLEYRTGEKTYIGTTAAIYISLHGVGPIRGSPGAMEYQNVDAFTSIVIRWANIVARLQQCVQKTHRSRCLEVRCCCGACCSL